MEAFIIKETLRHIIECENINTEYLSKKINVNISDIEAWLDPSNQSFPSFSKAEDLSKEMKIPLAALYMQKEDVKIDKLPPLIKYRSLHAPDVPYADSILNIAIHSLIYEKKNYMDLASEVDIKVPGFSIDSNIDTKNIEKCALGIRKYLNFSLDDQYKLKSKRKLFLYLRNKIEAKGVFTCCFRDVPQELCRGLAIYDDKMPIIGINDDRPPAKSFTILHEFTHILKKQSCYCDIDAKFLDYFDQEEIFCNGVAGECLVPKKAFIDFFNASTDFFANDKNLIKKWADKFSVSREVIVRRLLDLNKINKNQYNKYISDFKDELDREKEASKDGKIHYHGIKPGYKVFDRVSGLLSNVLISGLGSNVFSYNDVVRNTGVTNKSLNDYLREANKWNN